MGTVYEHIQNAEFCLYIFDLKFSAIIDSHDVSALDIQSGVNDTSTIRLHSISDGTIEHIGKIFQ